MDICARTKSQKFYLFSNLSSTLACAHNLINYYYFLLHCISNPQDSCISELNDQRKKIVSQPSSTNTLACDLRILPPNNIPIRLTKYIKIPFKKPTCHKLILIRHLNRKEFHVVLEGKETSVFEGCTFISLCVYLCMKAQVLHLVREERKYEREGWCLFILLTLQL
jgi:hypothetical protein